MKRILRKNQKKYWDKLLIAFKLGGMWRLNHQDIETLFIGGQRAEEEEEAAFCLRI